MSQVTRLLERIERGEAQAAEELLPLVYDELRRLARTMMAREKPGQTLSATALVHEAYLRLVDREQQQQWDSRRHFFAAAAEAMRRILVESARRKQRLKHGGAAHRIPLEVASPLDASSPEAILIIDDALEELQARDPLAAQLVKLRYFGGYSLEEAAELTGVSRATAYRHWSYAKAWLYEKLKKS